VRGEPLPDAVLRKWKLVVLGLDKDDSEYCECLGISREGRSLVSSEDDGHAEGAIVVHECFAQIEKDLERTFEGPVGEGKKREFENVLKRIANHFPKMGYTQGINFVVSYLVVVGFSERESFELFVHLATNQKYMLLGLYEDGFPLYNLLTLLLQNALRRASHHLYLHMFVQLGVDASMWICKWFMTLYTYSFPPELVKYVLDLLIAVGTLGIVTFALALIDQLEPAILQISELSDLNDFFSSLKALETFNRHINMQRLMASAYSLVLIASDFDGLDQTTFYGLYIKSYFILHPQDHHGELPVEATAEREKLREMLNAWRAGLVEERNSFRRNNKTTNISSLRLEVESLEKSPNKGSPVDVGPPLPPDDQTMNSTTEMPRARKNSISSKSEAAVLVPQRVEYHFNRINELEEEEQSAGEGKSRPSKKTLPKELDELDKLEIEFEQEKKLTLPRNNFTNPQPKTAHRANTHAHDGNSLSLAGRNSLRNSYDESVSSKQNSSKSKVKQGGPGKNSRICACKTKTE
jgi:hypothetical protein